MSAPTDPQRAHYVAGASGTGTSTRAMQVQRTLQDRPGSPPCIVIATDVVRAQLRAVLRTDEHPDLWGESFNLPVADGERVRDGVDVDAFARQCAPILRAVEAGVDYALTEGWDVVVEGVHLVPGAFRLPDPADVRLCVELLVVEDPREHAARFRARDAASGGRRPAAHYERNLPRIRAVQAELVDRWHEWTTGLDHDTVELRGPGIAAR